MSDAYIVRRGKIIQGGGGWNMQSKAVTPTAYGFTVTPDSGYDGLSSVTVYGDTDLKASNIKSGINIFGVTGSYGGGGGFDPNGAVLKVVTSTGCSVAATGTGYSQTHQNSEGFPRSNDANVTEHFFSIPASAFGEIVVTAHNTYGDNTQTVRINTAGRVYELLCGGKNILLDSQFGMQSGLDFDMTNGTYEYDPDYEEITFMHSTEGVTQRVTAITRMRYDVTLYRDLKIVLSLDNAFDAYDYVDLALVNKEGNAEVQERYTMETFQNTTFLEIADTRKSPFRIYICSGTANGIDVPPLTLKELVFS